MANYVQLLPDWDGDPSNNDEGQWDGKRIDVYDTERNLIRSYDDAKGQVPHVYVSNDGKTYAGIPGTEEYDNLKSARRRSNIQGAAKVAAVVGGGILAGGLLGPAAAGGGGAALPAGGGVLAAPAATAGTAGIAAGAPIGSAVMAGTGVGAASTTGAALSTIAPAVSKGGLLSKIGGAASKVGEFASKNKDLIGTVLEGIGNSMAADKMADNERDLMREKEALLAGRYAGEGPGAKYRGMQENTQTQAPKERFSSENYGKWQFEWNARTGRMERVEVQAQG